MRLQKNGSTIFNDRYDAGSWPSIGQDLYDSDINLSAGDKLNFKLMEIRSGPPTGTITPYCALYNVDTGKFEMTWGLQLSTASGDTPLSPRSMMNTQLLSIQSAGAITGLDMQFYPSNSATINAKSDGKVRAGSYVTDSWHNTARSNKKSSGPKQATTEVYLNSVRTSMHGLLQNQSSTPLVLKSWVVTLEINTTLCYLTSQVDILTQVILKMQSLNIIQGLRDTVCRLSVVTMVICSSVT